MGISYGYVRVSSADQNEDRQLLAMKKVGIDEHHIFIDKLSGKDFNRPNYQRLIKKIRKGDVIYILSIDRLGRNYMEIQNQWRYITKVKMVDIVVIDMPLLDTRHDKDLIGTLISDIVLQILSFVAESERRSIKERQSAGIAAAKLRGVKFGRPVKKLSDEFLNDMYQWKTGKLAVEDLLLKYNISRATLYRRWKIWSEHPEIYSVSKSLLYETDFNPKNIVISLPKSILYVVYYTVKLTNPSCQNVQK